MKKYYLSLFIFIFFISLVSSEIILVKPPTGYITNASELNVNHSNTCGTADFAYTWLTSEGFKSDVADITYDEISGGDVNALGYTGFFSWLGSLTSRITKIFAIDLDLNGIIQMNKGNITNATYIIMNEKSGACDLTINHSRCSNVTGTYLVG